MKNMKIIIITGIIVCSSLVSCKKDYTCECNEYYEGASTTWNKYYGETIINATEKKAEQECNDMEGEPQTVATETYWLDCELK